MSISITQFNHLRIPLDEIQKATNNFSEENRIGKGDFGYIYEGQLLHSGEIINISAKRLDRSRGLGDMEFLTEVSVLSGLEHPNIVSLIGFCDEKGEKIIIHRHEAKGSLCMYLDDPTLTWEQRVRISVGVANAIRYIHYKEGRSYSIIHRNINSSTILLDDNFEPKLSGFEFSIKDSVDRTERYITSEVIHTQGYTDPETKKSGDATQKSDIYSFGVVLCEIMCGRKAFLPNEQGSNRFLASLARFHLRNDTLQDIINPGIFNQMAQGSYKLFVHVIRSTIGEDRKEHRDMNVNLYVLKEALDRQVSSLNPVPSLNQNPVPTYTRVLDDATFPSFDVKIDENEALRSLNPSMAGTFASRGVKKDENEALYRQVRSLNPSIAETFASRGVKKDENEALYRQVRSLNPRVAKTFPSFGVKKDENEALQPPSKDELGVVVESKPNKPRKVNKLEHLRIEFVDIQLATDNFSEKSAILLEDPVDIYKGDLELYDRKYVSSLKGKNIGELPKRRYNVRIMCFKDAAGVDPFTQKDMFYREIEIISTCKHDNIDSLLGFCDEGSHMILVFEGNNCNLMSYLDKQVLTWDIRLKICLDVAHGLKYIHNEMEDQKMVIHRQLNSACIWLDDDWQGAKISGFGVATFRENEADEVFGLRKDDGFTVTVSKESDIYSFGLVMFEILCGVSCNVLRMNDVEFRAEHWFKDRIIKQKVARVLREENLGNKLFLKKGPNEDSLDTFIKITEQCLAVNPKHRPTLQVIIMELRKALTFQENHTDHLRMSFKDIESATKNFSRANEIGGGGFGRVYKGKLASEHGSYTIVAKRLDKRHGQGDQQFYNELHILSEYKHENVIGLVGYSNDEQERIIVYEYASKGSLDRYLNDASLTWINRLNICADVARGLAFLHGGVQEHEAVIHRDMKTANILLFDDWKAKVADFGLSLICTIDDETNYVIDHACGTRGYLDPVSEKSRTFTKESDIYSLGVILFEILYGKSTYDIKQREKQFLHSLVQQRLEEGRLDEVVFNAIKKQIVPEALLTFQEIAYQCLHDDREKRPTAQDVLVQLQKALELQVKDVPVSKES